MSDPQANSVEETYFSSRKRLLETSVDAQYGHLPALNMYELRVYYTVMAKILTRYAEEIEKTC